MGCRSARPLPPPPLSTHIPSTGCDWQLTIPEIMIVPVAADAAGTAATSTWISDPASTSPQAPPIHEVHLCLMTPPAGNLLTVMLKTRTGIKLTFRHRAAPSRLVGVTCYGTSRR